MSVARVVRGPWGWFLAVTAGAVGGLALAGTLGAAAILAGLGIGAGVLAGTIALSAAARRRRDRQWGTAPRVALPDPPPDSRQARLHARGAAAILRIGALAQRTADPWVTDELHQVLARAAPVAESMGELTGRITLLDESLAAARPDRLATEMAALQDRMRTTRDPAVRSEQEHTLAALDTQAEAVDRLLARRDVLLAQLQAAAVGLEGLAARGGELVAMAPGDPGSEAAGRIVADLTTSLEAVRAGVDEAQRVLRELDGPADPAGPTGLRPP